MQKNRKLAYLSKIKYLQMAGNKRLALAHDAISKVGIANIGTPSMSTALKA